MTLEQRAYIHEDVQDLIFAPSYFVSIRGVNTVLAPLRDQQRGARRVDIKAQHELAEFLEVLAPPGRDGFPIFVRGERRAKNYPLRAGRRSAGKGGFDLYEWGSGVDLHIGYDHHLPDSSREWGDDLHL